MLFNDPFLVPINVSAFSFGTATWLSGIVGAAYNMLLHVLPNAHGCRAMTFIFLTALLGPNLASLCLGLSEHSLFLSTNEYDS
jgi:hypothetical protein